MEALPTTGSGSAPSLLSLDTPVSPQWLWRSRLPTGIAQNHPLSWFPGGSGHVDKPHAFCKSHSRCGQGRPTEDQHGQGVLARAWLAPLDRQRASQVGAPNTSSPPRDHRHPRVCLYSVAFLSSKPWGYLRRHPLARATEDLGWARLRVVPFPIPGLLGALELCGGGTPLSRHCGRDMWTYRPKRPSGCAEPGLSHSTPTPREGLCKSVFPMSPHVALESRAWVLQLRDLLLPPDGATPMYRGLLRLRDTLDLPRSCVLPLSAAPWGAGGGRFVFGSMDGTFPVGKTVSLYSTSPAYPALPTL